MLNEFEDELTSAKVNSVLRSSNLNALPLAIPVSSLAPSSLSVSPRSLSPRSASPRTSPRSPISKTISLYGAPLCNTTKTVTIQDAIIPAIVSTSPPSPDSSSAAYKLRNNRAKSISSSNLKSIISQPNPGSPVIRTPDTNRIGSMKEMRRDRSTSVKDIKQKFEELIKLEQDCNNLKVTSTERASKSPSSSSLLGSPRSHQPLDPPPITTVTPSVTFGGISVPSLAIFSLSSRNDSTSQHSPKLSAKESKKFLTPRKSKSSTESDLVFEMDDDLSEGKKSGKKDKKHKHKRKNSSGGTSHRELRLSKEGADAAAAVANIPRSTPRDVISPRHLTPGRGKEDLSDDDRSTKKDKKKHTKHKKTDSKQLEELLSLEDFILKSPRNKLDTKHKKPPPLPPSLDSLPARPNHDDISALIKISSVLSEGGMFSDGLTSPPSVPSRRLSAKALNLDLTSLARAKGDEFPVRPSPRTSGILKEMKNRLNIFDKAGLGLSPRGRSSSITAPSSLIDIPEKPSNLFSDEVSKSPTLLKSGEFLLFRSSSMSEMISGGGRKRSASITAPSVASGVPMGLPFEVIEDDAKSVKRSIFGGDLILSRPKQGSSSKERGLGLSKHSSSEELLTGKKYIRVDSDAGLDQWASKPLSFDDWPQDDSSPQLIDPSCKKSFYFVEAGRKGTAMTTKLESLQIIGADDDVAFYDEKLTLLEHNNYFGEDESVGPVVISLETPHSERTHCRAIIRTKQGDERVVVPLASRKDKIKAVSLVVPKIANVKFLKSNDPELIQELLKIESQALCKKFKFGVLYCKEGQLQEDDMFCNENGSPDFNEFLDFLGDRVVLEGWKLFRGGLDVKTNTTGKESIYATHRGYEVMFHCSTLLPFTPGDPQQLERKRHLGNDIVIIVFKEGDQPLDPSVFRSHFIHIWFVVSKITSEDGQVRYRMEVVNKPGMKPHKPYLPEEPIFEKSTDFRNFLLTKLINAERAALASPEFKTKSIRTRTMVLHALIETATKKKYDSKSKGLGNFFFDAK